VKGALVHPCSNIRDIAPAANPLLASRLRAPGVAALLACLGVFAVSAGAAMAAKAEAYPKGLAGPSARVNPLLLNSPGYVPPNDPESLSVVIGRRLNAPVVSSSFTGGHRSLDALGRAICTGIHHADRNGLGLLCITEEEFTHILWREFPQSRPATGATAEEAWYLLWQRNHGGISRALGGFAGQDLQFVRWDRGDTVATYRNFRLHNGLTLVVMDEQGRERRLDIVRSVAERRGAYKLYSLRD
jgi:hypothetical protein